MYFNDNFLFISNHHAEAMQCCSMSAKLCYSKKQEYISETPEAFIHSSQTALHTVGMAKFIFIRSVRLLPNIIANMSR